MGLNKGSEVSLEVWNETFLSLAYIAMKVRDQRVQLLRGVAILSVLLFHLEPDYFQGGFVGIDLFLFISGYVLYPSLRDIVYVNDFKALLSSCASFTIRRFRRLFPSFFFMFTCSLMLFPLIIPVGKDFSLSLQQLISAFFIAANWSASQVSSDYFSHYPNLFLHLWSLSYEEQIYLLIILLFLILFPFKRLRKQSLFVVIILFFSSLLLSGYPTHSYYNFMFRLWEFGAGMLLAYFSSVQKVGFRLGNGIHLLLYCLLFLLMLVNIENVLIFRLFTLLSVSSLILLSSGNSVKALNWLQEIGNRSYSIYLFHYPFLVYSKNYLPSLQSHRELIVIASLVLSLLFAEIVYRRIEVKVLNDAFWNRNLWRIKSNHLILVLCPLLIAISVCLWALNEQRFFGFNKHDAAPSFQKVLEGCDVTSAWHDPCVYGKSNLAIALVGDSHASALAPLFASLVKKTGFEVHIYSYKGCKYVKMALLAPANSKLLDSNCRTRNEVVSNLLASNRYEKVFVSFRSQDCSSNQFIGLCGSSFTQLVIDSVAQEQEVILLTPVPEFVDMELFPPRRLFEPYTEAPFTFSKSDILPQVHVDTFLITTQLPQRSINTSLGLCNYSTCLRKELGKWLWIDSNHLSKEGANKLSKYIELTLQSVKTLP